MKHWIAEYVATAKNCQLAGRKEDARRWMGRAKGLKAYLCATDKVTK